MKHYLSKILVFSAVICNCATCDSKAAGGGGVVIDGTQCSVNGVNPLSSELRRSVAQISFRTSACGDKIDLEEQEKAFEQLSLTEKSVYPPKDFPELDSFQAAQNLKKILNELKVVSVPPGGTGPYCLDQKRYKDILDVIRWSQDMGYTDLEPHQLVYVLEAIEDEGQKWYKEAKESGESVVHSFFVSSLDESGHPSYDENKRVQASLITEPDGQVTLLLNNRVISLGGGFKRVSGSLQFDLNHPGGLRAGLKEGVVSKAKEKDDIRYRPLEQYKKKLEEMENASKTESPDSIKEVSSPSSASSDSSPTSTSYNQRDFEMERLIEKERRYREETVLDIQAALEKEFEIGDEIHKKLMQAKRAGKPVEGIMDSRLVRIRQEGPNGKPVSVILQEKMDGDLLDYFDKGYKPEQRNQLFKEIATGVKNFHDLGYVHGDLKEENIFMLNGKPKIGDFGGAYRAAGKARTQGTMGYMASNRYKEENPAMAKLVSGFERLKKKIIPGFKAEFHKKDDAFSLGFMMLQNSFGHNFYPFEEKCGDFLTRVSGARQFGIRREGNAACMKEAYKSLRPAILTKCGNVPFNRCFEGIAYDAINPEPALRITVGDIIERMPN